ncbi:MAG: rRNA (cytosine1962-C5)-methyltransferase [Verrucomicrobiota bacterium]
MSTKQIRNQNAPTRLRLRVTSTAESIVRSGHPWLFADSVLEQNRPGLLGELAVIYDRRSRFLAVGLFDPDSPIRARVLHAGKPATIDQDWWADRLNQALERRKGLFDERTTGYRWINGESDGWPGLILDRYGTTLVMKLYTAAWLPRLQEIVELFAARLRPEQMVLRLSRNIQEAARTRYRKTDGEVLLGPTPAGPVIFLESGLRFEADVMRGQKTGFFLDQRENRRHVESLARGRRVLNAFSFSGGFSLYAARGGASAVTDLDISPHALSGAKRNFALNQSNSAVADCKHLGAQGDAFEWLARKAKPAFGLIILDPPSLARRESERAGAIHAYGKLARLGLEHLEESGILVACSCSAHVTADEFFGAVRNAAATSGRTFEEMQTTRHAPDHPATFKEAEYLKTIFLRV